MLNRSETGRTAAGRLLIAGVSVPARSFLARALSDASLARPAFAVLENHLRLPGRGRSHRQTEDFENGTSTRAPAYGMEGGVRTAAAPPVESTVDHQPDTAG